MKSGFQCLASSLLKQIQLRVLLWFLGGEQRLPRKFVGTFFHWRSLFENKEKHDARARWFACGFNRA